MNRGGKERGRHKRNSCTGKSCLAVNIVRERADTAHTCTHTAKSVQQAMNMRERERERKTSDGALTLHAIITITTASAYPLPSLSPSHKPVVYYLVAASEVSPVSFPPSSSSPARRSNAHPFDLSPASLSLSLPPVIFLSLKANQLSHFHVFAE